MKKCVKHLSILRNRTITQLPTVQVSKQTTAYFEGDALHIFFFIQLSRA
jgi:hypothetical protein